MTLLLPDGPYAGVNGPLLRKAAAKLSDMDSAKLYDLAVVLGVSQEEARSTWEQLISEGFIEILSEGAKPTDRMGDLARARFGKPLPRKKAEALVNKAIAAAEELNSLPPDAPYFWVTRLLVFGSYLHEDKSELGDLDLAWEIEERPGVKEHVLKAICYNTDGQQTTRAKICPRGPYVRLTSVHQVLKLGCPYREVYAFKAPGISEGLDNDI